jgi:hypothetical protein
VLAEILEPHYKDNMDWKSLKEKIYYLDGSLRDIYVKDTTRNDWEKWIDLVNNNYSVEFYNGQTEKRENRIDKNIVFDYWERKTDILGNATIKLDTIIIKCYFFIEQQIENDIAPAEINSIDDHNKLLSYLKDVSKVLDKKVFLTPESYSGDEPQLITVERNEVSIRLD